VADDSQNDDEQQPPAPPVFEPPPNAPPPVDQPSSSPGPGYAPPPQPSPPPPGYAQPPPPAPYGYGQPPPPYATYGVQPYVARKTNGFAIASLILGALWIYWLGSILALIFGYIGKGQIDKSGDTQDGRGLAVAGIALGWIGVAVLAIFLIALLAGA
jgi:hypothetical protein